MPISTSRARDPYLREIFPPIFQRSQRDKLHAWTRPILLRRWDPKVPQPLAARPSFEQRANRHRTKYRSIGAGPEMDLVRVRRSQYLLRGIRDSLNSPTLQSTRVFKYRAVHFAIEFLRVEHVLGSPRNSAGPGALRFTALCFITLAFRSLRVELHTGI